MPEGRWRPESRTAGSAVKANPDTAVSQTESIQIRRVSPDREYQIPLPVQVEVTGRAVQSSQAVSAGCPTAMLIRIFAKKRSRKPYGDIVHYDLKNKPEVPTGAAELS